MTIDGFDGEHRFLSNFWPCSIVFEGLSFPSVEHAYQAAKTLDQDARLRVAKLAAPGQAKRAGRSLALRLDWEDVKLNVMRQLLLLKFADTALMTQLQATAPAELLEGNTWGDRFWGVCNGDGLNHLGKMLMAIRDAAVCS
jgi:N-glycosidase YbiA